MNYCVFCVFHNTGDKNDLWKIMVKIYKMYIFGTQISKYFAGLVGEFLSSNNLLGSCRRSHDKLCCVTSREEAVALLGSGSWIVAVYWDFTTHHIGIITNHYKVPYEPISIKECHEGFDHCLCVSLMGL